MVRVVAFGFAEGAKAMERRLSGAEPGAFMIAKDIAGLSPDSGQAFRWALLGVCIAVGAHHILAYAARVKRERRDWWLSYL